MLLFISILASKHSFLFCINTFQINFITKKIHTYFKEERIDGEVLLDIQDISELRDLQMRFGSAKKIMRFLEQNKVK